MELEKKELVKPIIERTENIELYMSSEGGGSNDAPACDSNGGTANCAC